MSALRKYGRALGRLNGREIDITMTTQYSAPPIPSCLRVRLWRVGRLSITWSPRGCRCHRRTP